MASVNSSKLGATAKKTEAKEDGSAVKAAKESKERAAKSAKSAVSGISSLRQERIKAAAKTAALKAEAEVLQHKERLAREALKLKQEEERLEMKSLQLKLELERLDLQAKMAAAEAEERVYEQAEEDGDEKDSGENASDNPILPVDTHSARHVQQWLDASPDGAGLLDAASAEDAGDHVSNYELPGRVERHRGQERSASRVEGGTRSVSGSQVMLRSDSVFTGKSVGEALINLLSHNQDQHKQLVNLLHLPKIELTKYDGDPLRYFTFIRSFESMMEKEGIPDDMKLTALSEYTKDKAKLAVDSVEAMSPSEGYKRARELLKERFGNRFIICQAWLNKVTEGTVIKPHEASRLLDLSDNLKGCICTLTAMDMLSEIDNQSSILKVMARLPQFLQLRWRREAADLHVNKNRMPKMEDLSKFLSFAATEANDPVYGVNNTPTQERSEYSVKKWEQGERQRVRSYATDVENHGQDRNAHPPGRRSTHFNTGGTWSTNNSNCPLCAQAHSLEVCEAFKRMPGRERYNFTQGKRLCRVCLFPGHMARNCSSNIRCTVDGCNKRHARLLHPEHALEPTQQQAVRRLVSNGLQGATNMATSLASSRVTKLMPVIPVTVWSEDKSKHVDTYALLDSCSSDTFCSSDLVNKLNMKARCKKNINLTTLAGEDMLIPTTEVSLVVSGQGERESMEYSLPLVLTRDVLPVVGGLCEPVDLDVWPHLCDISVPCIERSRIGIIIGQDYPEIVCPIDSRRGPPGSPVAIHYTLGWTLCGKIGNSQELDGHCYYVHINNDLDHHLRQFWQLDDLSVYDHEEPGLSYEDHQVIELWQKTLSHVGGHYQMDIPFKVNQGRMPDSRPAAERRLAALGRRLTRDTSLAEKYASGMTVMLEKGYAEPVNSSGSGHMWYLPHQPVISEQKGGKVRIVFDCAAKSEGLSLNDQVLQGPDLMNNLLGVLLRFRCYPIAFTADIEAMYHQVRVSEKDRDMLRFLWWPDGDMSKDPAVYRMTSHLFGGLWSPSAANFVLKRAAVDFAKDTSVAEAIISNFYVDDLLKSCETVHEARTLARNLKSSLAEAGFNLTKWTSNSKEVIEEVSGENGEAVKNLNLSTEESIKRSLGVKWDVAKDTLGFSTSVSNKPFTKRGILSCVSSVFDPMGFASPFILIAKRLVQDLTKRGLSWDEVISSEDEVAWRQWKRELPLLEDLKVPRCVKPSSFGVVTRAELHHFSDASGYAYGAVSYVRLINVCGQVHCSFLIGKARLAPIRQITIPRLELMAAVIAAKQDKFCRKELGLQIQSSTFWCDSQIVLSCIKNSSKRFKTFVANRLSTIWSLTSSNQWCHVGTEVNPADIASRGSSVADLTSNNKWFTGPEFLWSDDALLEAKEVSSKLLCTDCDILVTTFVSEVEEVGQLGDATSLSQCKSNTSATIIEPLFERLSCWKRLKGSVACILRAVHRFKCLGRTLDVARQPVEALQAAEDLILSVVQQRFRSSDDMKSIRSLDPYVNDKGLLCVGGRLKHAALPEESKHQSILPPKHCVTEMIIRECHKSMAHVGVEHVLSVLREKYWIISGRREVKKVLNNCVHCKRKKRVLCGQKMADLPAARVTPCQPPFTDIGVDVFGPFEVKSGRSTLKRYGCLFTCLASRAIHVEVLFSLDVSSFINALKRFSARRGWPSRVWSDNGTNFVAADRELYKVIELWNNRQVENYLKQQSIEWHYNPPYASHMGGAWERLIRSVRDTLAGLTTMQRLDDESLSTLLCMAEAIINSRPLTKVSDDSRDVSALTPNHLLMLRGSPGLPVGDFVHQDLYARRRWRQVQYLADIFWKRWIKEYIPQLQYRQKWRRPSRNITVGDVVLLADDLGIRNHWPMGRVTEVEVGSDGLVRAATVVTQHATCRRPIHKLCLLEAAGDVT